MPNWCEADLLITGTKGEIARFKQRNGENLLDADAFIPYPLHFKEMDEVARKFERDHPDAPWEERPKDGFNSGGFSEARLSLPGWI